MGTLFSIINIVIMLIFIISLFTMTKKHVSFPKRAFTALGLGIVYGIILHLIYGANPKVPGTATDWFSIVGDGYVTLLQIIVMPLIFVSIVSAFGEIQIGDKFAKIGSYILMFLIGTVAIAAVVGIFYAIIFGLDASSIDLGSVEHARGNETSSETKQLTANTLPQQILELLPSNPLLDFTGQRITSTIAVVIFAIFVGFVYLRVARKQPDNGSLLKRGIDAVYALIMSVVTFVLRLIPYGIIAIMASTIVTSDFSAIWTLGKFTIASYAALLAMCVIHLIVLAIMGIDPIRYVKKTPEVLIFVFISRSSTGALLLNVQTQTQRLGVPEGIANFSASFGLSIGQDGYAGIYPAMLAIMVAPVAYVNIDIPFILTLIGAIVISLFGIAGVGGSATFASILVLSTLNLPVALAGVLASIEPIIDVGRTALNVNDSILAGTGTARLTGNLDRKKFNSNHHGELSTES